MSKSISDQNLEETGMSCTCCDGLLRGQVSIEGNEDARLVSCGACHRTWFREDPGSFVWTFMNHRTQEQKDRLEDLSQEFDTVSI